METEINVAPILNEEKRKTFFISILQVFLGYSFYEWTESIRKVFNLTFLIPSLFLWLFSMLVIEDYVVVAVVSTAVTSVMIWLWILL